MYSLQPAFDPQSLTIAPFIELFFSCIDCYSPCHFLFTMTNCTDNIHTDVTEKTHKKKQSSVGLYAFVAYDYGHTVP